MPCHIPYFAIAESMVLLLCRCFFASTMVCNDNNLCAMLVYSKSRIPHHASQLSTVPQTTNRQNDDQMRCTRVAQTTEWLYTGTIQSKTIHKKDISHKHAYTHKFPENVLLRLAFFLTFAHNLSHLLFKGCLVVAPHDGGVQVGR